MELDARQERRTMGIEGCLGLGGSWSTSIPYGHKLRGNVLEFVPNESYWVCKIWKWYANRVPMREIRQRLLQDGVPQMSKVIDQVVTR